MSQQPSPAAKPKMMQPRGKGEVESEWMGLGTVTPKVFKMAKQNLKV